MGWVLPSETRCEYVPVSSSANVLLAKVSEGNTHPILVLCARLVEGRIVTFYPRRSGVSPRLFQARLKFNKSPQKEVDFKQDSVATITPNI